MSKNDPLIRVVQTVEHIKVMSLTNRYKQLLVTLEVKNAFNSAKWKVVINELKVHWQISNYLLKNIKSYLTSRSILAAGECFGATTGIPQRSVLGPLLWNIL